MLSRHRYTRKKITRLFSARPPAVFKGNIMKMEAAVINIAAVLLLLALILFLKDAVFSPKKKFSFSREHVSALQIPNKTLIDLRDLSVKYKIDFSELLTIYCFENNFFPTKTEAPTVVEIEQNFIRNYDKIKNQYAKNIISPYCQLFDSLASEMVYFPIPVEPDANEISSYMYGDSWGSAKKSYDNGQLFEGTDIYDRENMQGRLPIVSVCAGTLAQIGWNDASGYTISIQTDKGNTFTYTHMDSFADNLTLHSKVKAGQLIGYMGNTGYGKKDEKNLRHQVRIHFGISVSSKFWGKEFWINPYPFLRLVEQNKIDLNTP